MSTIDSQVEAVIAEDAAARNAAVQTLLGQGYTFHGGEQWKPPLGEKPNFSVMDELRQQLADVSNERDTALNAVALGASALDGATRQRDALQLRLNASEARNAELSIYESFPCYLIDHCEGATVYEEKLQHWLAEHIKTLAQSEPATEGESHE